MFYGVVVGVVMLFMLVRSGKWKINALVRQKLLGFEHFIC